MIDIALLDGGGWTGNSKGLTIGDSILITESNLG